MVYYLGLEILNYDDIKGMVTNIDNGLAKKSTNFPNTMNRGCRTYVTYKDINDNKTITFITRYFEKID